MFGEAKEGGYSSHEGIRPMKLQGRQDVHRRVGNQAVHMFLVLDECCGA